MFTIYRRRRQHETVVTTSRGDTSVTGGHALGRAPVVAAGRVDSNDARRERRRPRRSDVRQIFFRFYFFEFVFCVNCRPSDPSRPARQRRNLYLKNSNLTLGKNITMLIGAAADVVQRRPCCAAVDGRSPPTRSAVILK